MTGYLIKYTQYAQQWAKCFINILFLLQTKECIIIQIL